MKDNSTHSSAHGTTLPALALRLAIGPTIFAHGYNKVFGSGGLEGTERWFSGIGFSPAKVHARAAATTEMTSGVLITLGAANPLPSAALIGVMVVAARSDHREKGFFVFKGGWEYVAVMSAAAAALAALGNGNLSVDRLIGNRRRGWKAFVAAGLLGVANGALVLKASFHPEPPAPPAESTPNGSEAAASNGSSASASGADATDNGSAATETASGPATSTD